MANSLRAKLSKLKHDGHIDNAEYQKLIKKLDGHDRELRNKAIEEFAGRLDDLILRGVFDSRNHLHERIHEIAESMKGGK